MKKLFLLLLTLLPMAASADESGECGSGVTFFFEEATGTLTISKTGEGTGLMYLDNFMMTNQDFPWYSFRDRIQSIIIENGVISISGSAFSGCSGLTSITIPNSVTQIGKGAFKDCSSIVSIVIDATNSKYDSRNNCNAIIETSTNKLILGCKNSVIPDGVTSIGNNAFSVCSGLTSINIPDGVTSIGDSAFEGCSNLTSLTIGKGVTSIGGSAFSGCRGLISVNIPDGVNSIGKYTFSGCNSLVSVIIPTSVTSIGISAFSNCNSLASVVIPNGVKTIGEGTFASCSGLTSVTIPNSVTSIGDDAFYGCKGLNEVHINDLTAWCNISFSGYDSNPLRRANHLFLNDKEITNLIIPTSITNINNFAFCVCSGLKSVTIPNTVTLIGEGAFRFCI